MSNPRKTAPTDDTHGLVGGGQGDFGNELLEDGQEEVFSRTEVETGRIEHKTGSDGDDEARARFGRPQS